MTRKEELREKKEERNGIIIPYTMASATTERQKKILGGCVRRHNPFIPNISVWRKKKKKAWVGNVPPHVAGGEKVSNSHGGVMHLNGNGVFGLFLSDHEVHLVDILSKPRY